MARRDASGAEKTSPMATITGRTDRQTDRQTDRVRRNMRPPPREEGRIITKSIAAGCNFRAQNKTKTRLPPGLSRTPLRELTALPNLPSWYSAGVSRQGREGRKGQGNRGEGREVKEREVEGSVPLYKTFLQFNQWTEYMVHTQLRLLRTAGPLLTQFPATRAPRES